MEGFNAPGEQWRRMSSPKGAAEFLAGLGMELPSVGPPVGGNGP